MSTSHQRPTDTRTLATQAAGALTIALGVNLALGWLALTAATVTRSEVIGLMALHVPPAIVAVLALPETPLGR